MDGLVLITRACAEPMDEVFDAHGVPWVHLAHVDRVGTGTVPPQGRPAQVLLSSAAALEHVHTDVLDDAEVWAVGQATAAAAEARGLSVVWVGRAGGAALLQAIEAAAPPGPIWHVGGWSLSQPLERALSTTPLQIARWVVYRRQSPPELRVELRRLPRIEVATFASPSAVTAFYDAGGEADLNVAIGPTTASAVRTVGFAPVVAPVRSARSLAQTASELWLSRRAGG